MKNLVAERIQGEVGALLATGFHPMDVGNPLNDYETLDIQAPRLLMAGFWVR